MAFEEEDQREILLADAKTATLAGGGLGFGILSLVLAVPILSALGLVVSFFGWKTSRPGYRVGRGMSIAGIVISFLGGAVWITLLFVGG